MNIRESFAGRHLLVTGFTGFLGKVWVAMLLEQLPEIGMITLLVRRQRNVTAEERVRKIFERSPALRSLRKIHGDSIGDFLEHRVQVVEGDAGRPLLGIDPDLVDLLAPTIDAIVHCAGVTSFAPDPIVVLDTNVRGAEHAADLAARTPSGRLLHISTCFVAGEADGQVEELPPSGLSPNGTRFDVDAETIALESACQAVDEREGGRKKRAARRGRIEVGTKRAHALGWPNLYTYSKGLAEHSLTRRTDISLTIIRPAIVECAREFPFPGWNEGVNTSGPIVWMISGFAWKIPLRKDNTFDVVPVDTIARGMTVIAAAALNDNAEPVYQLASGDHKRFTFERAMDLTALSVRRGFLPKGISRLERAMLTHTDATGLEHGQDRSLLVPAAKHATTWLRDSLKLFKPERHLPTSIDGRQREKITKGVATAALQLNKTSMLLKAIEQLWKSYQPFIYDFEYRFFTRNVRFATAELSEDEKNEFGWNLETLEWRTYWMDVQIPGLDKWSLPLLRGQDVPDDEPFDLGIKIAEPSAPRQLPAMPAAMSAGRDAE